MLLLPPGPHRRGDGAPPALPSQPPKLPSTTLSRRAPAICRPMQRPAARPRRGQRCRRPAGGRRGARAPVRRRWRAGHADSVFPNNWFSTHAGAMWRSTHVCAQPPARAAQRHRRDAQARIPCAGRYRLLGPGARQRVFSKARVPWCWTTSPASPTRPSRTAPTRSRWNAFCTHFNYEPMAFATADAQGQPCYHTT